MSTINSHDDDRFDIPEFIQSKNCVQVKDMTN